MNVFLLIFQVMELETQVQVSTNQLRRQDEDSKKVKEELESALNREREMGNKAREQQHRFVISNTSYLIAMSNENFC